MSQLTQQTQKVMVWDPLVRVFHWSLVLIFFLAYITEDDWLDLHIAAGYAIAYLIGFRLVWGVVGTPYAKMFQVIKLAPHALSYLKKAITFKAPHYMGHNPAASAMIIALILSIIMVIFTGFILIAGGDAGPLAGTFFASFNEDWVEEIHEFFSNFTLLLVVLHVAGVIFSSFIEGENLVLSMINGYKKYRSKTADTIDGEKND